MVSKTRTKIICEICDMTLFDAYYQKHLLTKRHLKKQKGLKPINIIKDYTCINCDKLHTAHEIKLIKSKTYEYFEGCWPCWYVIQDLK
jgi:hypothetical protein